jgi:hypothetical protein
VQVAAVVVQHRITRVRQLVEQPLLVVVMVEQTLLDLRAAQILVVAVVAQLEMVDLLVVKVAPVL